MDTGKTGIYIRLRVLTGEYGEGLQPIARGEVYLTYESWERAPFEMLPVYYVESTRLEAAIKSLQENVAQSIDLQFRCLWTGAGGKSNATSEG